MHTARLVLGLVLSISGAAAAQETSDPDYSRGVRLQQAGDLNGAQLAYEAALRLSPRRIDALSNLGLVYAGLHDYTRAIRSFQTALEIDPKQPVVLFNLGITCLQAGRYEEARRALAEAAALPGGNPAARQYLGIALLKLGRIEEGIAELEPALERQPDDPVLLCTLASAYLGSGRFDKARPLVETRLARYDTAEARFVTGSYYLATHNYRQAVVELRRAQQLNPVLPELGSALASAFALTGSQETAVPLFEAYLRDHPSDYDSLAFLGWLYLEANRIEEAAPRLEAARRIKPEDPDLLFQVARLERARSHFADAAALLEKVVAARPDHRPAHVLLAQTYFRLKRTVDGKREQEIVRRLSEREQAPAQP